MPPEIIYRGRKPNIKLPGLTVVRHRQVQVTEEQLYQLMQYLPDIHIIENNKQEEGS